MNTLLAPMRRVLLQGLSTASSTRTMSTMLPRVAALAPSASFVKAAGIESPSTTLWAPGGASNPTVVQTVQTMLKDIREGGEAAAQRYASELDNWPADRSPVVSAAELEDTLARVPQRVKDDIQFQHDRVVEFAMEQRKSLHEFEVELFPGVKTGQRVIPVQSAGCYVPGGRFSHVSSAIMSVATAKVAGVKNVVCCSPPLAGTDHIHPATLYAAHLAGADCILTMGGVQGVAALAYGLFSGFPADVIVGPGNNFVAEAKRELFGLVGIDMFAGPTEIAILADHTADPLVVATDLVSQAEHGPTSPAWLITTSQFLADVVADAVPVLVKELLQTDPTSAAGDAWRDYGEIIVVKDNEEMAALSDHYAAEHLQVHCEDLDWWLAKLENYGSLFLGEETTVTYGDKASGPNHILPTKRVGRYSGGLSVDKFMKKLTYQSMNKAGSRDVGERSARISRLEGMEGHARSADVRLEKYFPDEEFELDASDKYP